ncbi:MAG: hypothetical protein KJP19_08645, partial [Deltaproteobacteria bacterium]|nr:hypothetical protein [Deltaproteobacteria bacterium]
MNYRDFHMPIFRAFFFTVFIAGCGTTPDSLDPAKGAEDAGVGTTGIGSSSAKYQYVGTYEHFATPMGSAISVLMVDGQKIKLASVDDTTHINIPLKQGVPEMRRSGTYGMNGEFKNSATGGGGVF